ncbi:protein Hook homolog 3-like [Corticium candelabrum]|uniref:protein Hook homolog 3-like n=1 Tax=Corticium candelabrum TaxID=121492 RepID=UPI002E267F55|nr:protein Hook homolog 3-like [Corticium candelabrum]
MDASDVCESLIVWLGTISNIEAPHDSPADLCDGAAVAEALTSIAPDWFDQEWLSRIKRDVGDNWRLKVSNLKKIVKRVTDYYEQILHQQIESLQMPDVNLIGEHADTSELGRLLQLILGCAVHCENKHEYIQRIMQLEEEVQHAVMGAIQELMQKGIPSTVPGDAYKQLEEEHHHTLQQLHSALAEREELEQQRFELKLEVETLKEERISLVQESERLTKQLKEIHNPDSPDSPYGQKQQQMHRQLEQLKQEKFEREHEIDDHRLKLGLLEKQLNDLQQKNEDLHSMAEQAQRWKDEVDELRHEAVKVEKLELTLDSYKKKVEDTSELRKQVRTLEDKNRTYMQQTMELEDELRKLASVKSQLESYKKQVHQLDVELREERKQSDKVSFELRRVTESLEEANQENQRLIAKNRQLMDLQDEIDLGHSAPHITHSLPSPTSAAPLSAQVMAPQLEERITELERENEMLKARQRSPVSDAEQQVQLLQSQLDDVAQINGRLERELRTSHQKVYELETQIGSAGSQGANRQQRMAQEELARKATELHEADKRLKSAADTINQLQDKVATTEEEKRLMEKKYKKYLDKAKKVIEQLGGSTEAKAGQSPKIDLMQRQLAEKDKMYESLEREFCQYKEMRDREERCTVSAWYNMGLQLQRRATEERLASSAGVSFLSRQRHALSKQKHVASANPLGEK